MKDKRIEVRWDSEHRIKTKGHRMPDGWWYIYLPFDKDWHFVRNEDVTEIDELHDPDTILADIVDAANCCKTGIAEEVFSMSTTPPKPSGLDGACGKP